MKSTHGVSFRLFVVAAMVLSSQSVSARTFAQGFEATGTNSLLSAIPTPSQCEAGTQSPPCVESVWINGRPAQLIPAKFPCEHRGPLWQTLASDDNTVAPATVSVVVSGSTQGAGIEVSRPFELKSTPNGAGRMLTCEPGSPSGLDPTLSIRLKILIAGPGRLIPTSAVSNSLLTKYELVQKQDGSISLDFEATPTAAHRFSQPSIGKHPSGKINYVADEKWIEACTAPNVRADVYQSPQISLYLHAVNWPSHLPLTHPKFADTQARRGVVIASNHGCGGWPRLSVNTRTGALSTTLHAPHFTTTGDINMGFFQALLPPSYLIDELGISIEDAVTKGVTIVKTVAGQPPTAQPVKVELTPDGLLSVRVESFSYSAPRFTIKASKVRGKYSSRQRFQPPADPLLRGSTTQVLMKAPGHADGFASLYVVDRRGTYRHLGRAPITNGKVSVDAVIPADLRSGKGRLIVSYGSSSQLLGYNASTSVLIR